MTFFATSMKYVKGASLEKSTMAKSRKPKFAHVYENGRDLSESSQIPEQQEEEEEEEFWQNLLTDRMTILLPRLPRPIDLSRATSHARHVTHDTSRTTRHARQRQR